MRGHVNLPPCLLPAQELMKVEAKWQCLTVTLKLCAGPGGHLSHKLCHQSQHAAGGWICYTLTLVTRVMWRQY